MKKLVPLATLLALIVIVFGALVRLSDAGLGCPDWPGCYGQALVAEGAGADIGKAWIEMGHRYLAGTLGLLILAIAAVAWLRRDRDQPALLPALLLVLVVFQALLGMWTVTLLLKPVVVTLHLLGGMATLALLVWLMMRTHPPRREVGTDAVSRISAWSKLGLILLFAQIALGGWVSANYAALACGDFPLCRGQWIPPMDFAQGFQVARDLGQNAAGAPLRAEALTAIHWTHRLGALIVSCYFTALAAALFLAPGLRVYGALVVVLLAIQIALGIANVFLGLPLALAVAHNAVAALLLMVLVMLNFRTHLGGSRESRWHRA